MRTEEEMFQLIMDVAKQEEHIRAVGMVGSRTNMKAPKDSFQDFDIVYIVEPCAEFFETATWIAKFGQPLIMRRPKEMTLFPTEPKTRETFLMLFEDGQRIDLTLCPLAEKDNWHEGDSLAIILLDKDENLPPLPVASDKNYTVTVPNQHQFNDCCNEFWWVSTYVVKGLCRNELFYAVTHLYEYCQQELLRLLSWQAAWQEPEPISVGKQFKYLKNYVTPDTMDQLASLLDFSSKEACWNSLIKTQAFFDVVAQDFAKMAQFTYHLQ